MTEALPVKQDFEFAVTVAQIFSGVTFTLVAIWMTMTNGVSLAFIQRASLEKRLTVCCFINTYVGMFSAFFNFFQLTQVDDLLVPAQNNYTIDLARPIEWIATCPLMQLVLVILGGSKIPESRRTLMPLLSVIVLCFGLTSTYLTGTWRYVPYAFGLMTALLMFALNAKQIVEHSDGLECFRQGDSEYRKASLLVIVLWFPFPIWYALSPEGIGLIEDDLLIQVGWAFLNIVSKFSFIFYVQRMKDQYCTKLKAKRENYQPKGLKRELDGDLTAVLMETLSYLGMAQHSDRIINLFGRAGIVSASDITALTMQESKEKMLPWDIVKAVQQRLRVWRLETQDNAEADLKDGETHYFKTKTKPYLDDSASTPSVFEDDAETLPGDYALAILPGNNRPPSAKSTASTISKKRALENAGRFNEQMGTVHRKLDQMVQKLNDYHNSHARFAVEEEASLLGKIEMIVDSSSQRNEMGVRQLQDTLVGDLRVMAHNTAAIGEQICGSMESQEAALADVRRQHMMLMELVSNDRDSIRTKIEDLNANINVRVVDSSSLNQIVRTEMNRADGRSESARSVSSVDQNPQNPYGGFSGSGGLQNSQNPYGGQNGFGGSLNGFGQNPYGSQNGFGGSQNGIGGSQNGFNSRF